MGIDLKMPRQHQRALVVKRLRHNQPIVHQTLALGIQHTVYGARAALVHDDLGGGYAVFLQIRTHGLWLGVIHPIVRTRNHNHIDFILLIQQSGGLNTVLIIVIDGTIGQNWACSQHQAIAVMRHGFDVIIDVATRPPSHPAVPCRHAAQSHNARTQ